MTMDDAVNNARQRREQLKQQEDEAAKRMHAFLDAILVPLAALSPQRTAKRRNCVAIEDRPDTSPTEP
jgi:hypothetical protein